MHKKEYKLETYRNIPDGVLISDLRSIARRLKKKSIRRKEYISYGKFSAHTYYKRFGSWLEVLDRAGLERISYVITLEQYISNLEKVWDKLGRQPRLRDMVKPLSSYSEYSYCNYFGSWGKALEVFVRYMNNGKKLTPSLEKEIQKYRKGRGVRKQISLSLRFLVLKRDDFKCVFCGRSPTTHKNISLHIDHKKPVTKGGKTVLKNLQTLCSRCNIGKGNRE
ncbi:MAG: homing endonuclease associated repeat-containing protein [Ignavibacteria bacterium]